MPVPGVNISTIESSPSRGVPTDTGVGFVVGLAQKGPTTVSTAITSLTQFEQVYGSAVDYSVLYNSVEIAFREGASTLHVARVVGPAALASSVNLNDSSSSPSLKVAAKNPGDWGNTLRVSVVSASGGFTIQVSDSTGVVLENSPILADQAAAVLWGSTATYVTVTKLASANVPVVVTNSALTGGTDDRAAITNTHKINALSLFPRTKGPGQVAIPGETVTAIHTALLAHAKANNRFALIDLPDTAVVADLVAATASLKTLDSASYGLALAPFAKVAGTVPGTLRTVPYSAIQLGVESRRDSVASPNRAAAGRDFPSRSAVDLNQVWTDADRETLNSAGVNVVRNNYGQIGLYGYRSLVNPVTAPAYVLASASRLRMKIVSECEEIGEQFMFAPLDGRGHTLNAFKSALVGILLRHHSDDALWGETPEESFVVEVGPSVNTPQTIALGQLKAGIALKISPFAEAVYITITKVPLTSTL